MHKLVVDARYRWLRLRHDWWYRWAHDPLCDRLGGGVLKIGKLRLCRSCVAMYAGVGTGLAASASLPTLGAAAVGPYAWLGAAGAAAGASAPQPYKRLNRRMKDGLRFGTGVLAGLLPAFARSERWRWFAALVAVAGAGYRILTLARAKAKSAACDGCPELETEGICSGFAQQAVSLRAYEAAASDLAMRRRGLRPPQPTAVMGR